MSRTSSQFPVLSSHKNQWSDGRPRPSEHEVQRRGVGRRRASTGADARRSTGLSEGLFRWLKFNAVGAIGIVVQVAALALLRAVLHLDYLIATAFAVETAVIHNFLWHERFTWADRPARHLVHSLARLAKFNAGNGLVSLAGNLLIMRALVGQFHLNYILANLIAVGLCSTVNFLLSDRLVFES